MGRERAAVANGGDSSGEQRSERLGLLVLLLIALVVVAMIIRPFAGALFMAAVLAVTFHPWCEALARRLHGRRKTAATLLTAGLVLALVLPVATLVTTASRESMDALDSIHQVLAREGVEGLIHRLPAPIQPAIERVWRQVPARERDTQVIFDLERRAATVIPHIASAIGQTIAQVTLTVIALFFLLLDGSRLIAWLSLVSPLHKGQIRELLLEFRRVSATVLLGSVATAGGQAIAALIGYLIAGVQNPYFLTLATFFVGLIPVLGAGGFSFAVAIYLYLSGHLYASIFLAIWSLLVVSLVDNVLKPFLIKRGIEMHGGVVFFTLIGGLAAFGPIGFVLGPMSVTLLLALLRIYRRDFTDPEQGTASP